MPNTDAVSLSPIHRLLDLALIAFLVVYAVYAMVFLWQRPHLLALILLPLPLVLVARLGPSSMGLAVAGSIMGPATEICCVIGGLWNYTNTGGLMLIPPWLFVIWACFPTASWLIVRSLLGSIPLYRPGTLPLAIAGIII